MIEITSDLYKGKRMKHQNQTSYNISVLIRQPIFLDFTEKISHEVDIREERRTSNKDVNELDQDYKAED